MPLRLWLRGGCNCVVMTNVISFLLDRTGNEQDVFLVGRDAVCTYAAFKELVFKCSDYLDAQHLPADAVVCLAGSNTSEYLGFLFAALGKGYSVTNINPNLTPFEIVQRVQYVKSPLLLVEDGAIDAMTIAAIGESGVNVKPFSNVDLAQSNPSPFEVNTKPAAAFIQFTGGTSGAFKAAIITHENIIGNVSQIMEHFATVVKGRKARVLVTIPFYHSFSLVFNVFHALRMGGSCVLVRNVRVFEDVFFAARNFVPQIMVAVNTMYKRFMQHPAFNAHDFDSLEICIGGGEKIQPDTKRLWKSKTGKELYEAYGLTETTAMLICNPLNERNSIEYAGIALPGTQIKLLNNDGNALGADEKTGDIWVKGPQVTIGYYANEHANNEFFAQGWFNTGDVGEFNEEGFLKILDRSKDLINVSGLKVYPAEVEAVLMGAEGVLDCAVIGIKDEHTGERVVACIVSQAAINEDKLKQYCTGKLAAYKVPKEFIVVDAIPKSGIGKTSRQLLKQKLTA